MQQAQVDTDYRYERKFVIAGNDARDLEAIVRTHPLMFRKSYPPRYVNNIYLDTAGWRHYGDHVSGVGRRRKVRVRWYGACRVSIERPTLEFKVRTGEVGCKLQHVLAPFCFQGPYTALDYLAQVEKSHLPCAVRSTLSGLRPVLANRYRREYFESADRCFRLTLDFEMSYFDPIRPSQSVREPYTDREQTIVELKYSANKNQPLAHRARLPFRLSRFSKYVQGVQRVHLYHG